MTSFPSSARHPFDGAPDHGAGARPAAVRIGRRLRGLFDRAIAASSEIGTGPVLDVRNFAWTAGLRAEWQVIRDEAIRAVEASVDAQPYVLWGCGFRVDDHLAHCPRTAAALGEVPGLTTAFFSRLHPGAHIADHRGLTKGLVTCHLGLIVPRGGDARMRIGDRIVRWAEGETLVFDDTYRHEAWNEAEAACVLLTLQFARPLRYPGRWVADLLMGALRRSALVREARANDVKWGRAIGLLDL